MSDEKQNLKTETTDKENPGGAAKPAEPSNDETVQLKQHINEPKPDQTKSPDKTTKKDNASMGNTETEEPGSEPDVEPKDPIAALKAENAELKDKMLRLTAEMENLRRRTEREKQDIGKYAISVFARDLLTVDDNFQRTLQAVPENADTENPAIKSLVDGVEMTGRELMNIFERHGIKKINPAGEIFDPNSHQAMFEVENPNVPAGTVTEVVAKGYMIGERVLRPAMVGLAKGGEKPSKQEAETKQEKPANDSENTDKAKTDPEVDKSA